MLHIVSEVNPSSNPPIRPLSSDTPPRYDTPVAGEIAPPAAGAPDLPQRGRSSRCQAHRARADANEVNLGVAQRWGVCLDLCSGNLENRENTPYPWGAWGIHPWGAWGTYKITLNNTQFRAGGLCMRCFLDVPSTAQDDRT